MILECSRSDRHKRQAVSSRESTTSLPLSHYLSIERYVPELMPRHSRSDVCPGCLIQLQKYSLVGEAATTQPPLPAIPLFSSNLIHPVSIPSLQIRALVWAPVRAVRPSYANPNEKRSNVQPHIVSIILGYTRYLLSGRSLCCSASPSSIAQVHGLRPSNKKIYLNIWSLIDQLSCLDFDNGCNCNANRLKQF